MLKSARLGSGIRGRRPAVLVLGEPTPQPPVNTAAPVVSGQLMVGETLTTTNGTWTKSPTGYDYQWYSDGSPVGSNQNTYVITGADTFVPIYCVVTATNLAGSDDAQSNTVYVDESLRQFITGTVFDVDASRSDSYSGSGAWKNLVFDPNDGSAQTDYDFTVNGNPVFTGSPGDHDAYWLMDGTGDRFTAAFSTDFTNALHKTTGGTDFWIAANFRFIQNDAAQNIASTQTNSTSNGIRFNTGSNENIGMAQGNGTTTVNTGSSPSAMVDGTDYIVILTYQASTGATKIYKDTNTPLVNTTQVYNTNTSNAAGAMTIGASNNGGSTVPNGTRFYGVAAGNSYLSDADAQAIIDEYTARRSAPPAGFDLALLEAPANYTNFLNATTIGGITNVNDFCFSEDGTKLYIADSNAGTTTYVIHQCDLSTPWDVTTAVETMTLDVESISTGPKIDVNAAGDRLFLSVGTEIRVFAMTDGDINTVNLGSPVFTTSSLGLSQRFSYCNTAVYDFFLISATSSVKGYEAAGPTSATYASLQSTSNLGCYVNPDGTKLWACANTDDTVYQYTFGTPGDVSTLSYDSVSFAVGPVGLTTPRQIRWSSDGQKFYLVSDSNIVMWDLA